MNSETFAYLVIGLTEWLEQERRPYPYPPLFQDALNRLSLSLLSDYPRTLEGVLRLFARPVGEWWSAECPPEFASAEPLIEDGTLSYEAMNYLDYLGGQDDLSFRDSLARIELVVANRIFRNLFERLREKYLTDSTGAQNDYVTLRRFLIENPYAKVTDISRVFSETNYITTSEVGDLYLEASQIADLMQYPDKEGQRHFWQCARCGPLYVRRGQLTSVKSTACDLRCIREQDRWRKVEPTRQLRVLRKGIHLRTHIPGIPELELFTWLEQQRQEHPEILTAVVLWPRIDTYDIQVNFSDSVWAIDVKNHRRPHRLGRTLSGLYREGNLYWDKAFYVYPAWREKQWLNYGNAARQELGKRLPNTELLSDETFKGRVRRKIARLKKGDHRVQGT